jgi:diguanylate cyclase (GGDEF)-like protein/PAS domain S-box-containing protein
MDRDGEPGPGAPVGPDPERLSALLAATGDAFFAVRTRPDVAMEFITPSIVDLVGWTPEDHYADPDLIFRLLREDFHQVVLEVFGGPPGTEFELELCWTHRDGREVWSLHRGVVREREDGSVVVEGSGRDITALHETRVALEAAEAQFRLLAENSSDIVYLLHPDGVVEWISPSVTRILGWPRDAIVGQRPWQLVHPDDVERARASMARALDGARDTEPLELRLMSGAGGYHWMSAASSLATVGDGHRFVVTMRDVTEQVEARRALAESEARYRFLVEEGRDVVVIYNPDWTVRWVSSSVDRLFDLDGRIGADVRPELHPDDSARMGEMRAGIDRGDDTVRLRARLRAGTGPWVWTESVARPVRQADGALAAVHVVTRNVHDQMLAERRLAESERRFRLAMLESAHGMAIVGLDHRFLEVNPAMCRILGRDEAWLLEHTVDDVMHPDDVEAGNAARGALLDGERDHITVERRFVRGDGGTIWGQHAIGLLRDEQGEPLSFVSQLQDISRMRRAMQTLEYQASHDALTGLLNRSQLTDRLDERLAAAAGTGGRPAVLFCDVDRLKGVNDELGHAAGDALLRAISQRLTSAVRASDLVARMGGDEFVVLLDDVRDEQEAVAIAESIRRAVAGHVPFDGGEVEATMSIGVLLATVGADVDSVLRDADAALYTAKQGGRDRVAVFPTGARPHGTDV